MGSPLGLFLFHLDFTKKRSLSQSHSAEGSPARDKWLDRWPCGHPLIRITKIAPNSYHLWHDIPTKQLQKKINHLVRKKEKFRNGHTSLRIYKTRECSASLHRCPDHNPLHFFALFFLLRDFVHVHHPQGTSSFIFLWPSAIMGRAFQGRFSRKRIQETHLQIILAFLPPGSGFITLSFSHPTLKSETQHKIPFFVLTPVFPE
jgi:hypothetical protein